MKFFSTFKLEFSNYFEYLMVISLSFITFKTFINNALFVGKFVISMMPWYVFINYANLCIICNLICILFMNNWKYRTAYIWHFVYIIHRSIVYFPYGNTFWNSKWHLKANQAYVSFLRSSGSFTINVNFNLAFFNISYEDSFILLDKTVHCFEQAKLDVKPAANRIIENT